MATRTKKIPDAAQEVKEMPDTEQAQKEQPNPKQKIKETPSAQMKFSAVPKTGVVQNIVTIGDTQIEIKATKLKYQRNRTSEFYRILQLYPLTDILSMQAGQLGDDRDGDKALMDWLIAVTDNEQLITKNYDDIDTETVEQMLQIFRRVNKIDEKEQKLKNLEKAQKEMV